MKSFDQIGNELRGVQDSLRNPKPGKSGAFPHNPKPEGEIAARSVQFLLTELELQLKIRDEALESGGNAREDVTRLMMQVAERDERIAGLEGRERVYEALHYTGEQLKPPVPRSDKEATDKIYPIALDTIDRWRDAKIDRLEVEVERGKARRDVIREAAAGAAERSEAQIERLEARITSELEVAGDLGRELVLKDREISDMKEQVKVSTIAALAMFQKLKAAAVMAKSASAQQTAQYLLDAVNFHINGAMEVVNWLNGDHREEKAGDNECITDEAKPRGH